MVQDLIISVDPASYFTTRFLLRIFIVSSPSLLVLLLVFPKLITFNMISINHESRDVHMC